MLRTALLILSLIVAQTAFAGPNWQVTSFAVEPQDVEKLVAATDTLMASSVGKTMPGTVSLMVNIVAGASPSTHSYISAFDSLAEREAFFAKITVDPAWAAFQKVYNPATEPGGVSRMSFVKSWGEESDQDVLWQIHAFTVSDPAAYIKAVDALMASETGKTFPGRVHLSSVDAAGMSPSTHLVSVGFQSEAEGETWNDMVATTSDWTAFLKAARKVSTPNGTFVIRSMKTWGDTGN